VVDWWWDVCGGFAAGVGECVWMMGGASKWDTKFFFGCMTSVKCQRLQ
jgi:hypothetical protein